MIPTIKNVNRYIVDVDSGTTCRNPVNPFSEFFSFRRF